MLVGTEGDARASREVATTARISGVAFVATRCRSSERPKVPSAMVPRTATNRRLAIEATALLMPEAIPIWRSATPLTTAVVRGATVIAIPSPRTIIGGRNIQYAVAPAALPSNAKPTPAIAGPSIKGARVPKRSAKPPDQRDNSARITVKGR